MSKISYVTSFKQKNDTFTGMHMSKMSNSPYYIDTKRKDKDSLKESRLLKNDIKTNMQIAAHKCANTLSVYPAKGLAGSKNSSFYEQLTMSGFPYVMGGLTFIALSNLLNKKISAQGIAMGLGVVFFGIAKGLSKFVISKAVDLKTGIDVDAPYRKVVDLIPTADGNSKKNKEDNTAFEYHKVYESVDFPRFDLMYKKRRGEKRNEYFDDIAEKNGFGTNLKDSDQEVKPFIKEVLVKTKTAQNISQYLWAATGVALGAQKPWFDLINNKENLSSLPMRKRIKETITSIGSAFWKSCKALVNGGVAEKDGQILEVNKKAKYAGRLLLAFATLSTVLGTINAVKNSYVKNDKDMANSKIFNDQSKVKED